MNTSMQITEFIGPDGLQFRAPATPTPSADEALIKVDYAGANFIEVLFSRGIVPLDLPWTPGIEASGTLEALSPDADTNLAPGTPVAALTINNGGGYGAFAVTNAHLVAPIPAGLELATASAVPSNTTTALMALERTAHLQPGSDVLVHAGVGGVGSQFGQVAKLLGAQRVTAVVGTEAKAAKARELGYTDAVLRSNIEDLEEGAYDLVVDPVGGEARATALKHLRLGGQVLAVGNASQASPVSVSTMDLWFQGKGVNGFNLGAWAATNPALVGDYLRRALHLVATGQVKILLDSVVPLSESAQVLTRLEAGETSGKVVLEHQR